MAEEDRRDAQPPAGGIFGKLPDSRPGTRSPRRRSRSETASPKRPKATKATAKRQSAAKPKPAAPKPKPAAPKAKAAAPKPPVREAPEAPEGGRGLEDLAWAGVAVAAEAATVGVRLASKAIEALRGSQEPR